MNTAFLLFILVIPFLLLNELLYSIDMDTLSRIRNCMKKESLNKRSKKYSIKGKQRKEIHGNIINKNTSKCR